MKGLKVKTMTRKGLNLRNGDSTGSDWNLLLTRTPDSIGNQRDTDEYVKLSFSNGKVASDNFEVLQSLKEWFTFTKNLLKSVNLQ